MKKIQSYWHLILITVVTLVLGVTVFLTSQKLTQRQPVAPTVPQSTPKAAAPSCTLTFSIVSPTPTVTPTVTLTPTATPTSTANKDPDCSGLSVNPSSGTAPLAVNLTCSGIDQDGDITAAEFILGDGTTKLVEKNVGSPGSLSFSYTYGGNGTYNATCRVRDNNQKFSGTPDACKKTITVSSGGTTTTTTGGGLTNIIAHNSPTPIPLVTIPSAAPTPKVPVAGVGPSVLGVSIISLGGLLVLLGLAL